LKTGDTIILELTSPVGTTEKVRDLLASLRLDLRVPGKTGDEADIAIAYCPEPVLPGRILVELIDNDRVIGGITPRCARKALTFYRRFVRGACVTTTALIRTVREVNDGKTDHVIAQVAALVEASPGAKVACLGLAFKANIDDFRESPALKVAEAVARRFGDRVRIVEPYAHTLPAVLADTGATLIDVDTAIETCSIMIVLVDHDVFRSIPLEEHVDKAVLDTRGIWPDQPRAPSSPVSATARFESQRLAG